MKKIFLITIIFLSSCTYQNITSIDEPIETIIEKYNNNDVVGKIKIEGTTINNLILQSTDNKYYLNHNIKKEQDIKGEIFLDYRVNINDQKIIIYGHNSQSLKIPFKELEKYQRKSFFYKYPYIEIETSKKIITYEIFSVYIETSNFSYMNLNNIEEDYLKELNHYKNKSWYYKDISLSKDDKILILQTCSYNKNYQSKTKYLLIIAKCVK